MSADCGAAATAHQAAAAGHGPVLAVPHGLAIGVEEQLAALVVAVAQPS
ncbi:MAG: hypothetical protein WKG07_04110 [Hymenobacter sp.]